jgi:hypothetical protein
MAPVYRFSHEDFLPVYRLSHEEFLEWLSIPFDECLLRHKQAFMLNIIVIHGFNVISNYEKGTILEIAEARNEERLCCVGQHIIVVFSKKVSHFDMFALSIMLTCYYRDPRLPCNISMIGKKACRSCWSVE